ncbi:MAG: Signal transduction histidine kinase CheA [Myxococcaceae bacterium]|nr:Signal transduction histidine kinase CheA [Myxococcaceae bacterium]
MSKEERDPELTRLLILELTRHLVTLEAVPSDHEGCRRAVHALKGSAGLAGEMELAAALQRVERRVRDGETTAVAEAAATVRGAIARLSRGEAATGSVWPEPPEDLVPTPLDPLVRAQYAAELADRLRGIDAALESSGDPVDAATVAYRHVHTMKGAASAVGDEPMSWFCHGLEERLQSATYRDAAVSALHDLARWRAVLGGLLDDPDGALRMLRGMPPALRRPSSLAPALRGTQRPAEEGSPDDATIRVEAASIDRLLDRFVSIGLARERIAARAERTRENSRQMRRLRADLTDALRLIGPPRPWGAPAAALRRIERAAGTLAELGDELEHAASTMRSGDQMLRDDTFEAKKELSMMRQTPLRAMFSRLASAAEAEARRSSREVRVVIVGADETIDRRLAEHLVEPLLQIARNSVAHGIEPPELRRSLGKPSAGTITITARRSVHRLVVGIADDGAGVDIAAVRRRAVEAGAVAPALADAADDNTLLALLFLPGFSTRETSDLLAGRGIGLDIALSSIQRLGGALRLSSRRGEGFAARVEIPIERGLASVLWIEAGGSEYAIPASNAIEVRRWSENEIGRLPNLAACLEARTNDPAALALELALDEGDEPEAVPLRVGIDSVGRTEQVLIRPLTPLVATMGPYAGAIVREDGSLRLAIDVYALAPRARALGLVPDSRTSAFPSGP